MDFSPLKNKTVYITGASGLIGRALVAKLLGIGAKVTASVRSRQRAEAAFANLAQDNLALDITDVCDLKAEDIGADYVIHGANRTASKDFVSSPAEVINEAVCGTRRVLEFARANNVSGLVYLSTMEVYGAPPHGDKITENSPAYLNCTEPRSSYPESKRLCESLCAAYASEYGVPAKTVRLTQTFGGGVNYSDGRVFAEFARCAIEGRDIILKTKGLTERNYLHVEDAVSAILTVLLYGADGEAYNAANEDTYCSVYEMAEFVAKNFGGGKVKVLIREEDVTKAGYAPTLKMNLSAQKLKSLGWTPRFGLYEAFADLIDGMRALKDNL